MSQSRAEAVVILADIGGTNTRVALADGTRLRPQTVQRYQNADHADLPSILSGYLAQHGARVEGACIAVAGPIRGGIAQMTNLDWTISGQDLVAATGARRVSILNDLQAQGHALGHLDAQDLRVVIGGESDQPGPALVVGIGTGMNAAPVHDLPGGGRLVAPSECGHAGMPVRDRELFDLAEFVATAGAGAHGFAGVEDVLAGRGLSRIHAFVTNEPNASLTPAQVMEAIAAKDPAALRTARIYVRILGQVLGDLALAHLPFGGIYLIGGVARAMTPYLDEMGLAESFHHKGRFSDFMKTFSVTVIENDFAALIGCAAHLAQVQAD